MSVLSREEQRQLSALADKLRAGAAPG